MNKFTTFLYSIKTKWLKKDTDNIAEETQSHVNNIIDDKNNTFDITYNGTTQRPHEDSPRSVI